MTCASHTCTSSSMRLNPQSLWPTRGCIPPIADALGSSAPEDVSRSTEVTLNLRIGGSETTAHLLHAPRVGVRAFELVRLMRGWSGCAAVAAQRRLRHSRGARMQFSYLSSRKSVAQDHGVGDDTGPWSSFVVARGQSVSGEHRRFTSVHGIFVRAPSQSQLNV